jgi:predicted protein tyrosine phosphatase
MTHVLFICGKARRRSPTAADLVARLPGATADFGGLSADADERVSAEQIEAADVVAVMERRHLARLNRQFAAHLARKRVVCLNVPDRFDYMEPALVALLRPKLERLTGVAFDEA